MNKHLISRSLIASGIAAVLTACGGGGGGGGGIIDDIADIGGTGITASGTITGFGSVFVNGVEFETTESSISVDDSNSTESGLRIGMVVNVSGTINDDGVTGSATSITYDANLEGPISDTPVANADGTEKRFTVLGTTVVISDADTTFDDSASFTFDTIAQGDLVEVSGFINANGELEASFIESNTGNFTPDSTEVEAKGTVSAWNGTDTFTLTISSSASLTVMVDGATDLTELTGGAIANGQFVEVEGTMASSDASVLNATKVESEDLDDDVDSFSIEGIVTDFVSVSNFRVAGQRVDASGATFSPAGLVIENGVEVEAEGAVVNGILVADEVEARGGSIEVEATVSDVSSANNSITLSLGDGSLTFTIDSQTRMEDDLNDIADFEITDVNVSDFLEVELLQGDGSSLIATRVRRDETNDVILQGPVDAFDAGGPSVTILGVTFFSTGADYEDANDVALTETQFFDQLAEGDIVKIKDDDPADGTADEVEFED